MTARPLCAASPGPFMDTLRAYAPHFERGLTLVRRFSDAFGHLADQDLRRIADGSGSRRAVTLDPELAETVIEARELLRDIAR